MKQSNSQRAYHHRMAQRRRRKLQQKLPIFVLSILLIGIIGCGFFIIKKQLNGQRQRTGLDHQESEIQSAETLIQETPAETSAPVTIDLSFEVDHLLEEAEAAALGYDYDKAIELLQSSQYFGTDTQVDQAVAQYQEIRNSLKPYDLSKITHVFFHTLVIDESKAFDGDEDEKGYNQVMTTKDEFLKILQSMYDRGFVLVRLHDIAH